jgi:prevent-host-death family protein
MSRQVNLYEAKTQLSQLVEDAANGEEIIIAKNGKPMARLVGPDGGTEGTAKRRVGGQWAKYMTPEEREDFGSADWWRRWKEADEEILRDFEDALNDPRKDFRWGDTSSTPTPSSPSKRSRTSSAKKRTKPSRRGKTGSS